MYQIFKKETVLDDVNECTGTFKINIINGILTLEPDTTIKDPMVTKERTDDHISSDYWL